MRPEAVQMAAGAAVVVSVIHVIKGSFSDGITGSHKRVEKVTSFLFHQGSSEDPALLQENQGRSFIGLYLLGMGFTFDADNPEATSFAEMQRLLAKDR